MPTLIACLSTGKGTWTEVIKIIQAKPWDKVFLLTNQFGKENFKPPAHTELIILDESLDLFSLIGQIKKHLRGKITDFEVALNFVSGSGKEHLAVLEAVLELGLNFRLVTVKNNQLEVLGLEKT